jgi:EmrB/QacA subfamily drug resistance transporter
LSTTSEKMTNPPAHTPAPRNSTLIVVFLSLGGLSFAVLQSLVAPALSTIGHELNVSTADVSWILTAYLLSASVLTPVLGRLGDMVGKRRILIVVLVLLLVGAVLAAVAPNLGVLIVGRVIQGSAGAILPLSIGIVRDELPHSRVPATIGVLSAIFGIGAGVGIVAAGPIVQHLNWHWLFWLPAILVVVALAGAIFGMKESPVRKPGRVDIVGALILGVGLVAILLPIDQGQTWGWGDWKTIWLLVLGGVALIVFVLVELRVKEPLVDIRLLRHRGVWSAHLVALTFGFAMFGVFIIIPTLLQLPTAIGFGFGKTVTEAGLYLLPTVLAMVVFGPFAGYLVRRVGPKVPMMIGGLLLIVAFLIPAIKHDNIWEVIASGILTGAAIGMGLASMSNAIVESVPATQTGEATSVNAIARSIGSAIGTAVIAAIISSHTTTAGALAGVPENDGFTIGFWACAGVAVLAFLAALVAPGLRKSREAAAALGIDDFEVGS